MTEPRVRVGVPEAKTQLSSLLRLVAAGQEIEILRNGEPVACLVAAGPRAMRMGGPVCRPVVGWMEGRGASTGGEVGRWAADLAIGITRGRTDRGS